MDAPKFTYTRESGSLLKDRPTFSVFASTYQTKSRRTTAYQAVQPRFEEPSSQQQIYGFTSAQLWS